MFWRQNLCMSAVQALLAFMDDRAAPDASFDEKSRGLCLQYAPAGFLAAADVQAEAKLFAVQFLLLAYPWHCK